MPYVVALALVFGPAIVGVVAGLVLRRARRRLGRAHLPFCLILATSPTAGALVFAGRYVTPANIGIWDDVAAAALFGFGLIIAARARPLLNARQTLRRLAFSTLFGLTLLELLSRLLLPPAPSLPPAAEATLRNPPQDAETVCGALYPDLSGHTFPRPSSSAPGAFRVLHVGDSMVQGLGVRLEEAFPARLGALQPEVAHLNMGMAGAGPDQELLALRAALDLRPADFVALYAYLGNDIMDIGRRYPCCDAGPLLDIPADGPLVWRCPRPRWRLPRDYVLARSPPPYALRVAASLSVFARHANALFGRLTLALHDPALRPDGWVSIPTPERWRQARRIYGAIRDELRARGLPLLVVILPYRPALLPPGQRPPDTALAPLGGAEVVRAELVAMLTEIHIDFVDASDLFAQAIAREGDAPWFATSYPMDAHFSARGHQLLADWLLPRLTARGVPPSADP